MNSEKNESQKLQVRKMVMIASLAAIMVIMTYTPIGMVPLPWAPATIIHVPVIVGAILLGPKEGLILGIIMGLCSLSKAYISPASITDAFAQNPMVSVLPRAFIGIASVGVYLGLKKILSGKEESLSQQKHIIAIAGGAITGVVVNTTLFLGSLYVFYGKELTQSLQSLQASGKEVIAATAEAFIAVVISTNALAELIIVPIITVPIVLALKKVKAFK